MRKSKGYKQVETNLEKLLGDMVALSPEELAALDKKIQALNHTNCWWLVYEARFFLKVVIKEAAERRKYRAAMEAQMEYTILESETGEGLKTQVILAMAEGW